jgi:hypothetical protein
MTRLLPCLAVAAASLWAAPSPGQVKNQAGGTPDSLGTLTVREHFAGTLTYRTKTGATRSVRVALRQWVITGKTAVARFPQPGFLLVQLSAGDVTTAIAGKRQERNPDEFWTVPTGTVMQVEAGKEQAVLDVLGIELQ